MIITSLSANFSKTNPFVFKRFSSTLGILVKNTLVNFREITTITLNVSYLLVSNVLLLDVTENVIVELSIEAEEHTWIVQETTLTHLLRHRL